jgi:hypothetical protein
MRPAINVLSIFVAFLVGGAASGQPQPRIIKPDRLVAGTVVADLPDVKGVVIAGFTIALRSGDTTIAQTTTDAFGAYTFVNPPPGTYRLCWGGAAWKAACKDEPVVVGGESVHVRPIHVSPNPPFLFGRISGGSGAHVEARTESGKAGTATANVFGEYIIAGLAEETARVSVTAAGETMMQSVRPSAFGTRADLSLTPKQPPTPAKPPAQPVCPRLNYFFNCPPDTPGKCDNPNLALSRMSNGSGEADKYYEDVDPKHTRTTLADWLKVAGFRRSGGGGTRGFYTNDNDLGFGRDMHILPTDFGVFAYVTNYAQCCSLQNPGNARLAHKAREKDRIATVCMEWSTPAYNGRHDPGPDNDPANRFVKFFVYKGDGTRTTNADLDGNGPRFVPSLCINCHGGQTYVDSPNVKASFLPFDLAGFKFDGKARLREFRELNRLVKESQPRSAIVDLINGWYPAGGDNTQHVFRPPTFEAKDNRKKVYDFVIARSCRTCHIALKPDISWTDWTDFQFADVDTYTSRGEMPHAVVTKMNMYSKEKAHWPDEEGPRILKCFIDNVFDEQKMQDCIDKH